MPPPMIATSAFIAGAPREPRTLQARPVSAGTLASKSWDLAEKPKGALYNAGKGSAEVQSQGLAKIHHPPAGRSGGGARAAQGNRRRDRERPGVPRLDAPTQHLNNAIAQQPGIRARASTAAGAHQQSKKRGSHRSARTNQQLDPGTSR
jgi:hypothetical protein